MRLLALASYLMAASGLAGRASGLQSARARPRIETYDVSGETTQELRRDLNRRGPLSHGKRYDARTDWHVKWRFDFERSQEGCRVVRPQVNLEVVITLPRWRQPAGAGRQLVELWEGYLEALRSHEDGHLEVGQSAADEIRETLEELRAARDCSKAEQRANGLGHEIIERHNRRDERYDEETRHGATQGARFP